MYIRSNRTVIDLPKCGRGESCDLEVTLEKRGQQAVAECVDCDFSYTAGIHKTSGFGNRRSTKETDRLYIDAHGSIPKGLNIGVVASVVRDVLDHPSMYVPEQDIVVLTDLHE